MELGEPLTAFQVIRGIITKFPVVAGKPTESVR